MSMLLGGFVRQALQGPPQINNGEDRCRVSIRSKASLC